MGVAFQVMGLQNQVYFKTEWMNLGDFLHADSDAIVFGQTTYLTQFL